MTFNNYLDEIDNLKPEVAVEKYCMALDNLKASLKGMEPDDAVLFIKEWLYGASDNILDMESDDFFGTDGMQI